LNLGDRSRANEKAFAEGSLTSAINQRPMQR
jgi:hypothetical protein